LVERDAHGVYNVGSSTATSVDEVLTAVGGVVRVPFEPRVDPSEYVTAYVRRTQLDCSRLRAETGWLPRTSLTEGIEHAWEWTAAHLGSEAGLAVHRRP
jgi:UDP-glucose 4-epimerase